MIVDVPSRGRQVVLALLVRKFFCQNSQCSRRIFAELDLTRFWMVEEEKCGTESKYPSRNIDRSIATNNQLWRYRQLPPGMYSGIRTNKHT